ncbi:MAG: RHS repeat protein [Proteobacteria bacterium]|nr:RHS repeat protein [Pseudomonadota bacterium]
MLDDHGRISATALGSVTTTHGINGHGELQSFDGTYPGGSYSYSLVRDDAGRITEKTETIQGDTATTAYSYDDAGRLETVSVGAVITEEYAYDANGNRTSATVDGLTSLGTYDDQDRLVTYGGDDYSYGAAGHLESTSSGLFTDYDAFGNLMSVTTPSGTTVDYLVDAEGRRVECDDAASVTRYLWQDGLRIEAQLDGSDAVVSRFVYGESPNVEDQP